MTYTLSKFYKLLSIFPKHIIMIPSYLIVFVPTFEKRDNLNFNERWRSRCAPAVYDFKLRYEYPEIVLQKVNKKYFLNKYILITHLKNEFMSTTFKCIKAF